MIYLQDLRLTNFKCFEETSTLDFGKLTLLTGANSTGKSSLMYGILGVLQSKEFPLQFSPTGNYVQMGNFLEMVFKHESDRNLGIGFSLIDSQNKENVIVDTLWKCDPAGNPQIKRCECKGDFFHYILKTNSSGNHILDLDITPNKNKRKLEIENLLEYANDQFTSNNDTLKYLRYATKETHIKDLEMESFSEGTGDEFRYPLMFALQETMSMIKKYNGNVNYIRYALTFPHGLRR